MFKLKNIMLKLVLLAKRGRRTELTKLVLISWFLFSIRGKLSVMQCQYESTSSNPADINRFRSHTWKKYYVLFLFQSNPSFWQKPHEQSSFTAIRRRYGTITIIHFIITQPFILKITKPRLYHFYFQLDFSNSL